MIEYCHEWLLNKEITVAQAVLTDFTSSLKQGSSSSSGFAFEDLVISRLNEIIASGVSSVEQLAALFAPMLRVPPELAQAPLTPFQVCSHKEVDELKFLEDRKPGVLLKPSFQMRPDGLMWLTDQVTLSLAIKFYADPVPSKVAISNLFTSDSRNVYLSDNQEPTNKQHRTRCKRLKDAIKFQVRLNVILPSATVPRDKSKRPQLLPHVTDGTLVLWITSENAVSFFSPGQLEVLEYVYDGISAAVDEEYDQQSSSTDMTDEEQKSSISRKTLEHKKLGKVESQPDRWQCPNCEKTYSFRSKAYIQKHEKQHAV